jgi:hypothetical protein
VRPDLLRRICRLEARATQYYRGPVRLVWLCGKIDYERLATLARGERVVRDWCERGDMLWARDRITTDPDDVGKRCELHLPGETQPPGSEESDDAVGKRVCWLDEQIRGRQTSKSPPEATASLPA